MSLAPTTGYESDGTELALPGAWKRTPGKRKRAAHHHREAPILSQPVASSSRDSRPWSVGDWKRLEKVFRAEREAWLSGREMKPLPSSPSVSPSVFGWARRSPIIGENQSRPSEWDPETVVRKFITEEKAEGLGGEWSL